jgi:hypothetical protein
VSIDFEHATTGMFVLKDFSKNLILLFGETSGIGLEENTTTLVTEKL